MVLENDSHLGEKKSPQIQNSIPSSRFLEKQLCRRQKIIYSPNRKMGDKLKIIMINHWRFSICNNLRQSEKTKSGETDGHVMRRPHWISDDKTLISGDLTPLVRVFAIVRLAAHVSQGCKSQIRPVAGRI